MSGIGPRREGWRSPAVKQAAPYLATVLVLTILLVVGLLRARTTPQSSTSEPAPLPAASATSDVTSAAKSAATRPAVPPPPPATSAPPGTSAAPGTTAAPAPTGTRPAPTAAPKGPRIVAWIRDLGLTGGGGSYQEAFLAELSWGQCAELQRDVDSSPRDEVDETTRTLYRAAAQACLAAFHGRRALWPAADRAVEQLGGRSAGFDCIDRSVYALTRTLVRLHRDDPGAVLRRGRADDADGPGCPRLRSVEPGRGPAAGGYQVRITGEHLPDPAVIHFGEAVLTVPTTGGRTAYLTVPPMGEYDDVSVWVEGWPYEVNHQPGFTYDRPAGESRGA